MVYYLSMIHESHELTNLTNVSLYRGTQSHVFSDEIRVIRSFVRADIALPPPIRHVRPVPRRRAFFTQSSLQTRPATAPAPG